MAIPNIIADFQTTLALKVLAGATTATLSSITDEDGDSLPNGTYGFTIDRKNSSKEYITCTLTGTALTNIATIDRGTGAATSGFALGHRKGAEVIISDFVVIKRLQDVFETGYDAATTPTTDYMLATKKYVDDLALGGATTVDRVTVAATAGETIAAGDLVYLKLSDSEWYKTDADTVTTIDNVVLGIAQGSGTDGNAITSGVLIKGVDNSLTGLTANSIYYASNTAGGVSTSSGTITRVIGIATDTDKLYFDPEFNKTYKNYAADSVGTDAYAITLQSAFGAYYTGMEVTFKAGTANTGACTLNVNSLGAKDIKKYTSSDLVTGDITLNQIITVVYDGTNFQLQTGAKMVDVTTQLSGVIPIANGGRNSATPFKNGIATHDLSVSGTETIAHGLGATPSYVRITAVHREGQSANQAFAVYNGTTQSAVYFSKGDTEETVGDGFRIYSEAGTSTYTTGTITVDGTNISISWAKTSTPTGTATLLWEAFM